MPARNRAATRRQSFGAPAEPRTAYIIERMGKAESEASKPRDTASHGTGQAVIREGDPAPIDVRPTTKARRKPGVPDPSPHAEAWFPDGLARRS